METDRFKPDVFSKIVKHIIAPLWAFREKNPYLTYLKDMEKSQFRPMVEVKREQEQKLLRLIAHAVKTTEFYSERFRTNGLKVEDIRSLNDLSMIPLLTKDDIRSSMDRMVSHTFECNELTAKKTSGSTGVALEFYVDRGSLELKQACTIRHYRWSGWDIGQRIGAIWGNPWGNPENKRSWRQYARNLLLQRVSYLDTLRMDEQAMLDYYRAIKRERPTRLFGHAHSLYLFARFLELHGFHDIRPRGIISTCMVLHEYERKTIERVFDCKVTDSYGCEEVSLIASQCPEGNMHLNCDTLIVEFIRDGKPAAPGEPGAIVVTDLTNYGMPFIRYKVGDVGVPSHKTSCRCGCTYPIMDSLEGRVADYVITPDGNYISGISLTENFAMYLPGVKQMQIVQERVDHLTFRVVKGETFSEKTAADIAQLAHKRFGDNMSFDIEYVESIQSESSGKYRFCISKLPNPFS